MTQNYDPVQEFKSVRDAVGTKKSVSFLFEINKIEEKFHEHMWGDFLSLASLRQLELMDDEELYYGLTSYLTSFKEFVV
jgi:hypothetical protein